MKKITVVVLALLIGSASGIALAETGAASAAAKITGLESHFTTALQYFGKDAKISSSEIAKAAKMLKTKAQKSAGDRKKALEVSSSELETLSNGVKTGTIQNKADLETAFAKARAAEAMKAMQKKTA